MSDDEIIYANLTLTASNPNADVYSPATGEISYTSPILNKPNDFICILSRFTIDTFSVPLLIPSLLKGQTDPNKTSYCFALGNNGIYSDPIYVEYIPSDFSAVIPTYNGKHQNLGGNYYYIYDYTTFLVMWNNAMIQCLNNLNTKIETGCTQAPIFYFDPSVGITLKCPIEFYQKSFNKTLDANKIQIYFNGMIAPLVQSIQSIFLPNITNCNYCFVLQDNGANVINSNYVCAMENLQQLCYWQSLSSVQIQTNMPIVPEFSQGVINSNQDQSQFNSILTDFQPDLSNPFSYNTSLNFNQVSSLRIINLIGEQPMYNLSCSVFWTDTNNNRYPVYLSYGQSVSIKFQFMKKETYRGIIEHVKK